MTALLEIRGLKAEVDGRQILNGLDLTVRKGEIHAIMEAGEKLLRAGDILVQRGTNHSWSVRGNEPCIVAAVLVSAKPVGGSKKKASKPGKKAGKKRK